MSNPQHQNVLPDQGVDDPIISNPQLEESCELSVERLAAHRIPCQGLAYLMKNPLLIASGNLLQIVTDRCFVQNLTGQA